MCRRLVDKTGGKPRDLRVAKHDITVQIAAVGRIHTGPFVSYKRGELAICAAIVKVLSCLLRCLPGLQCRT